MDPFGKINLNSDDVNNKFLTPSKAKITTYFIFQDAGSQDQKWASTALQYETQKQGLSNDANEETNCIHLRVAHLWLHYL